MENDRHRSNSAYLNFIKEIFHRQALALIHELHIDLTYSNLAMVPLLDRK